MGIEKNCKVYQQSKGAVKIGEALRSERNYLLSMHTMTNSCSFTEVVNCEAKKVDGKVFIAKFESSNGERHIIEVTPGTQVLTTYGWLPIEQLDWTNVIVDCANRNAKLVSLTEAPASGNEYYSIITAFNRNVVIDGIVVREASVDSTNYDKITE